LNIPSTPQQFTTTTLHLLAKSVAKKHTAFEKSAMHAGGQLIQGQKEFNEYQKELKKLEYVHSKLPTEEVVYPEKGKQKFNA
jgi:hypothetical protein